MIVLLRRGMGARLVGGIWFQWIVTLMLTLHVALTLFVATFTPVGELALAELPALPWWMLWLVGIRATAEADDRGIRWQYFRRRDIAWDQVLELQFGGARVRGLARAARAAIRVRVPDGVHLIAPALGCRRRDLAEFRCALVRLAAAHGVPVDRGQRSGWWEGLPAA